MNNQPQAFPCVVPCEPPEVANYMHIPGMTLRDAFALTALGPIMATSWDACKESAKQGNSVHFGPYSAFAKDAYLIADAMLEERKKYE